MEENIDNTFQKILEIKFELKSHTFSLGTTPENVQQKWLLYVGYIKQQGMFIYLE